MPMCREKSSSDPISCVNPMLVKTFRTIDRTSKKPLMKFLGKLALGSSSALKYLRTWDSCFQ